MYSSFSRRPVSKGKKRCRAIGEDTQRWLLAYIGVPAPALSLSHTHTVYRCASATACTHTYGVGVGWWEHGPPSIWNGGNSSTRAFPVPVPPLLPTEPRGVYLQQHRGQSSPLFQGQHLLVPFAWVKKCLCNETLHFKHFALILQHSWFSLQHLIDFNTFKMLFWKGVQDIRKQ